MNTLRNIAVGVSLLGIAGCTQDRLAARHDVTQAALASYPGKPQQSQDVQVAAVDDAANRRIILNNVNDRAVMNPTVWVNGTFVHQLKGEIPPRGQAGIRYQDFIESGRGVQDLATSGASVRKVEVQTAQGLFSVLGPTRASR